MASTYATATTLLIATASKNFMPIIGKPTDDDIFNITKVLYPLLHNLKYDEFLVVGVENHNLVGLLQLLAIYTAARGALFARPVNPGPYYLTIPDAAFPVVRNRMEAAHMVLVNDFNTFKAAKDGIKLFIMANVNKTWMKPLRDPTSYYNNVKAYTMLEFSGGVHDVDLATLPADMLHYYATAEGIHEFILALEYSREKLECGGVPMSDATLLATAHSQVMGSLHYPEASRECERLTPAAKTWVAWQAHFRLANIERDRLLKMNPLAFGAANHVADTGIDSAAITMALDNIANAATNEASLIATLMERIKALELKSRQLLPSSRQEQPGTPRIPQTQVIFHSYLVSTHWRRHSPSLILPGTATTMDIVSTSPTPATSARRRSGGIRMRPRGQIRWEEATRTKDGGWETNPNPM